MTCDLHALEWGSNDGAIHEAYGIIRTCGFSPFHQVIIVWTSASSGHVARRRRSATAMVDTSESLRPLHVMFPLSRQIRCQPCVVAAYSAIFAVRNVGLPEVKATGCTMASGDACTYYAASPALPLHPKTFWKAVLNCGV